MRHLIASTLLLTTMAISNFLSAQTAFTDTDMRAFRSHNANPWGLVYEGATPTPLSATPRVA